ncbi:lysophospholipid acyltransferase family protein [Arachnia propionica]|uniref:1-acyl-sn-glycerol-3-phosphate acyltransferase n=1 Tax=Arachnia propionica TaxID=1750 RepID=A0A3P1WPM9_9ACTN|nr:lysophospholipid acyltransferase family protein [Arachnia propionica]RRD48589.1 1-acyl-sn-glycerol-3-phosphate acyltransferase [Arachnia propionica]
MASPKRHRKYSSNFNATARQAAQMLLLKPTMWRLLKVHVHGQSNLDGLEGACVVFANHASHLDTPLIYGALPRRISKFLAAGAAQDYWYDKWWKSGPMTLFFNGYPIDRGRDDGSRKQNVRGLSGALLDEGIPLLIFPEGSRSRTGAMGPFKHGVASLCISRKVPAVPVALIGAHAAWPSSQSGLPKGRPTVHVVIGRPMTPRPGEIAHEFSERMRRQVLELHDTTARAYGARTLDEYARAVALEAARRTELSGADRTDSHTQEDR